jgi:hypothetical protein
MSAGSMVTTLKSLKLFRMAGVIDTLAEPAMTAIGSSTLPATSNRRALLVNDKNLGHNPAHQTGQISMQNPGQYSLQINRK